MQSNIPQYILERGTSAREYRRRSSCVSRSSNSSMNQPRVQKDGEVSSPRASGRFDAEGGGLVDTEDLGNYKLSGALLHQQQMQSHSQAQSQAHKDRLDEYEYSTLSGMSMPPNPYIFSSEQNTEDVLRGNSASDVGELSYSASHCMRPPSVASSTDSGSKQRSQQPQRFGMARPRLVYF
ncbi:hypothetical protein LPJ56_000320 [Coemansia sp. RSA 2599]|nr:hypothetical protein LPJ75_007006 [Coemansia sp. RSA 2598]KAJ1829460.1 hypothetical protein LPJ56_000320 [Coemansia sp. RSA 2599]